MTNYEAVSSQEFKYLIYLIEHFNNLNNDFNKYFLTRESNIESLLNEHFEEFKLNINQLLDSIIESFNKIDLFDIKNSLVQIEAIASCINELQNYFEINKDNFENATNNKKSIQLRLSELKSMASKI